MKKNLKRHALGGLLCMLLASLLALPTTASETHTLTVHSGKDGVVFDLYQVATPSGDGWAFTSEFQNSSATLPHQTDTADLWRAAAETLSAYIASQSLTPTATQTTSGGQGEFSNLSRGLYLVVGRTYTQGDVTYTPVPALIDVQANTAVQTKEEEGSPPSGGEDESYQVVKTWVGGESHRTDSVTVQILRDGAVVEEVALSEANGWHHTWTSPPGHQWQVVELDAPEGFVVSVDRENNVFTITNTWPEDIPSEPEETEQPSNPEQPSESSQPYEPEGPEEPSQPEEPTLPQTGQLWWPVPVLLCAGVILFLVGAARSRRNHGKDKL